MIGIAHEIDDATKYSFQWYKNAVAKLPFPVIEILQQSVIKENVERILSDSPGDSIIFFDHGNYTSLIGYNKQPVISTSRPEILKDREVFTMACQSARDLGPAAMNAGCKVYWGYIEVVTFDTAALPAFEETLSSALVFRWRDKLEWSEVKRRVLELYDKYLNDEKIPTLSKLWLQQNRDRLRVYPLDPLPNNSTPRCQVSRALARLFGLKFLSWLRKIRERLFGVSPGYP